MYAELRPILHHFNELNILVLGDINTVAAQAILHQVKVLDTYLENISKSYIKIRVSNAYITTQADLLKKVEQGDVDAVFDQEKLFTSKFVDKNFYTTEIIQTAVALEDSIENFLVGSGVAWRLSEPVWNMQLSFKYMEKSGLCRDFYIYMTKCQASGKFTSKQIESIRYVVNKIKQINYSKDLLQYYIKRLRKAERAGLGDDDSYNLELNYHISNYYFLLAGTLDSVARLLNDFYRLGIPKNSYRDLGLEKENFIKMNLARRTGLARTLKNKNFSHWMRFLKERRNFIAHEGDMRQAPLVKERKPPLTDEEINAIVDNQMDWVNLAGLVAIGMFTQEFYDAQRAMSFDMAKIRHNYEVIARNVMDVPNKNGSNMWLPLMSVDFDYDKFDQIMGRVLSKLNSSIK